MKVAVASVSVCPGSSASRTYPRSSTDDSSAKPLDNICSHGNTKLCTRTSDIITVYSLSRV